MIYKTTSSGVILAKIFRDFRPDNSNWVGDAIEMLGEAIVDIGRNMGFERVKTPTGNPLSVVNHRLEYPGCMNALYGVEYRLATSGQYQKLTFGSDVSGYGVSCEDPAEPTNSINSDYQYYQTNVNYLYTSFETGQVLLHYTKVPTDNEGMPLILDSVKYREACLWYIAGRLMLNQTIKHPDPRIDFHFADARYELYKARTQNEYKMPSLDNMEAFTSMWTRLKFDSDEMNRFFKGGEIRDKKYVFDPSVGASTVGGDEVVIFD